jgi:hypothetical protein
MDRCADDKNKPGVGGYIESDGNIVGEGWDGTWARRHLLHYWREGRGCR